MPASSPSWRSMQLDVVAVLLGPAQVHAQQHLGPVLRLGAAGPGVDGHDGVLLVVRAGELELQLQLAELVLRGASRKRSKSASASPSASSSRQVSSSSASERSWFRVWRRFSSSRRFWRIGAFLRRVSQNRPPASAGRSPTARVRGRRPQRYPRRLVSCSARVSILLLHFVSDHAGLLRACLVRAKYTAKPRPARAEQRHQPRRAAERREVASAQHPGADDALAEHSELRPARSRRGPRRPRRR